MSIFCIRDKSGNALLSSVLWSKDHDEIWNLCFSFIQKLSTGDKTKLIEQFVLHAHNIQTNNTNKPFIQLTSNNLKIYEENSDDIIYPLHVKKDDRWYLFNDLFKEEENKIRKSLLDDSSKISLTFLNDQKYSFQIIHDQNEKTNFLKCERLNLVLEVRSIIQFQIGIQEMPDEKTVFSIFSIENEEIVQNYNGSYETIQKRMLEELNSENEDCDSEELLSSKFSHSPSLSSLCCFSSHSISPAPLKSLRSPTPTPPSNIKQSFFIPISTPSEKRKSCEIEEIENTPSPKKNKKILLTPSTVEIKKNYDEFGITIQKEKQDQWRPVAKLRFQLKKNETIEDIVIKLLSNWRKNYGNLKFKETDPTLFLLKQVQNFPTFLDFNESENLRERVQLNVHMCGNIICVFNK